MSTVSTNRINVPPGLKELLQELTVSLLRDQPSDLIQASIDFFTMKKASLEAETSKTDHSDEDDDEEPMPMPPVRTTRRAGVAAESYDPEKDEGPVEKVVHPKSDEQTERLNNATKGILLFRCLDEEQMKDVIDAMFECRVKPGDKVITQGDDGDNFYVIESGMYDIFVKQGKEDVWVGKYDNKGSFGELALMYNTPRAATIQATTDGVLWAMTREVFRGIVLKKACEKRRRYEELLNLVPLFETLSNFERMSIADALKDRVYEDGELILKQGDPGNEMYLVQEGEVRIVMKRSSGEEQEVARIGKGGYFGELALFTKRARAASAYAVQNTKLAVLDVAGFERLLGPCKDIMRRNIDDYEAKLKSIFGNVDDIPELRDLSL